jgi:hypothetical protein
MPTDIFKGVLFSDGEGADFNDFNNLRAYGHARLTDQILRAAAANARGGSSSQDPNLRTTVSAAPFLYSLAGGAGYCVPGGSALQTTVRAGTILQQVGSPSGDEPSFIPYTLIDGDFTLTHSAGDATNPRIDVIEIKLEYVNGNSETRIFEDAVTHVQTSQSFNKKRRVQITAQIKQGTPAATPAYPTLTSGFAAIAAVRVPATHSAVFTAKDHMRDLRIPLGVKQLWVHPQNWILTSPYTLQVGPTEGMAQAEHVLNSAEGTVCIPCPLPPQARIVGFGLYLRVEADTVRECKLFRRQLVDPAQLTVFPATTVITEVADISSAMIGASSTSFKWTFIGMDSLETQIAAQTGGPTRNAESLGDGIWGNGLKCGPQHELMTLDNAPTDTVFELYAKIRTKDAGTAARSSIVRAVWYYADGIV